MRVNRSIQHEIRAAEAEFGNSGRVLVRFSGTEPLARVMVEGPDQERVEHFAQRIASKIELELGADPLQLRADPMEVGAK